jgi:chaperone required for assembly of F1-ATPase
MKRFWQMASAERAGDCWEIRLDGKPMRLPGGIALTLRGEALARALAEEWQATCGEFSWDGLPLTQLAATAQHRIAPDPAPTVTALARYAESDCLCYRAEHPPSLAVRQHHAWQPWLDWAATTHDARLQITHGIVPIRQSDAALARLADAVGRLDAWQLAGLGVLVPAYGSLVLGLAVAAGAIEDDEALGLSRVDELHQQEAWGLDDEAAARAAGIAADVKAAARFMCLATT